MSQNSIRMADLLCDVANWNSSLATVLTTYADHGDDPKYPRSWKVELENEIRSWTKKRNAALAKLKAIASTITADELKRARRCDPVDLARQLREVGVHPAW